MPLIKTEVKCKKCGVPIHIPPLCRECEQEEKEAKADAERIKLKSKII